MMSDPPIITQHLMQFRAQELQEVFSPDVLGGIAGGRERILRMDREEKTEFVLKRTYVNLDDLTYGTIKLLFENELFLNPRFKRTCEEEMWLYEHLDLDTDSKMHSNTSIIDALAGNQYFFKGDAKLYGLCRVLSSLVEVDSVREDSLIKRGVLLN